MQKVEGVLTADASFIRGQAIVTYDPQRTSPQVLVQALNTQTLYRASVMLGIEPISPPENQTEAGGTSLPYFLVSSPFILGIGLFVYRRHQRARKSLVTTKTLPIRREDTS